MILKFITEKEKRYFETSSEEVKVIRNPVSLDELKRLSEEFMFIITQPEGEELEKVLFETTTKNYNLPKSMMVPDTTYNLIRFVDGEDRYTIIAFNGVCYICNNRGGTVDKVHPTY